MSEYQCRACRHPKRTEIEAAIVSGRSTRSIEAEFGVSRSTVSRHHKGGHIGRTLKKAARSPLCPKPKRDEILALAQSDGLIKSLHGLLDKSTLILDKAEMAGDLRTALAGIHEARGTIETIAKMTGELTAAGTLNQQVNVGVSPEEYSQTISRVIKALEGYPEARQSVLAALEGIKVIECPI